jgi:hypothetical protein
MCGLDCPLLLEPIKGKKSNPCPINKKDIKTDKTTGEQGERRGETEQEQQQREAGANSRQQGQGHAKRRGKGGDGDSRSMGFNIPFPKKITPAL